MKRFPSYTIERWPLGWTLSHYPLDPRGGIPLNALEECMRLFPKGALMDVGIARSLRETGFPCTCLSIVTPKDGAAWRKEIETALAHLPAEERWWRGWDCGASSATIFSVLATDAAMRNRARTDPTMRLGCVPLDADDFGRCVRLLILFPEWKARLGEVADEFSGTAWPAIIARWDEIQNAVAWRQTEILREINSPKPIHP